MQEMLESSVGPEGIKDRFDRSFGICRSTAHHFFVRVNVANYCKTLEMSPAAMRV
jgi:hypothetical protein